MLTRNNTTIFAAHGAPRAPTACPTPYVDTMYSKTPSEHRKIEHLTKMGPSEHVTSAVQNDCPTQNGTQKRHAHSKSGPCIAAPAHADGACRRPCSKSSKTKRMMSKLVALKRCANEGAKGQSSQGPCARLPSTTELKPAAHHIYTSARSQRAIAGAMAVATS